MATRFRIRVGDEECVCELLEDKAPNVCAAFRAALPIHSFAVHAKFAEEEIIVMLPLWAEAENFIPEGNSAGDVSYYTNRQTLCLFYGHVTPFGKPGNAYARLVEGQEAMRRAARLVMAKGSLPVSMFLEGAEEASAVLPPAAGQSPFAARLRSFLAAAWSAEPEDVKALRNFQRPLMGNRPSVFYACFDLFWATENLQVCREMACQGKLPPPQLNAVTAALLERTRRRLAHWEMKDTVALLADCVDYYASGGAATAEEYMAESQDLILAVDRVQSWIDAMIAWAQLDGAVPLHEPASVPPGTASAER